MKAKIHAHRAARGHRPENTLPAIEHALTGGFSSGVHGIEVDLCVTRDDVIVLHHDLLLNPALTRDANGQWIKRGIPIRDLALDELRQYDLGRLKPGSEYAAQFAEQTPIDGARAPTLDECVELFRRHNNESGGAVLNLELKSDPLQPALAPHPARYVALLLAQLDQLELSKNLLLQSFDWRLARLIKQRRPDLKTGFTKARSNNRPHSLTDLMEIKARGGDVFSCDHRGLNKPLVQKAHALGLEVYAWLVNETADFLTMIEYGVDVITTDYPDRCRALLYSDR